MATATIETIAIGTAKASKAVGIPPRTLTDLAKKGEAPGRKIGKRWVWKVADLNAWIDSHPTVAAAKETV